MTKDNFLEQKTILLQRVLQHLSEAESALDDLEALEVSFQNSPDHDALGISDLVGDAIELTQALVNSQNDQKTK